MILIPLSHESGQVQRTPYVTITILVINVLLFILTLLAAPSSQEEVQKAYRQLMDYYMKRPYLEIPDEIYQKIPPEERQVLDKMRRFQEMIPQPRSDLEPEEYAYDDSREAEQDELNRRIAAFAEAMQDEFYRKYGYIPARGGFFTLITSMFLHAGIFHLLFNMLFLWLSGGNIEDLWGRIAFPIFYLAGGIFASLTHALFYPESTIPLVGASGAIAALMGAFLVRFYKTRIYFFYFIFFGFRAKKGTFYAPAYLMLPLWLAQQLWEVFKMSGVGDGSGVAFWAHIGGFLFGVATALAFKHSGFEEKVLTPAIAGKIHLSGNEKSSVSSKLEQGDIDGAMMELRQMLIKDPEDAIAHGQLSRVYFLQGKERVAQIEFNRAVRLFFNQEDPENAVDEYLETTRAHPMALLEPPLQKQMAAAMVEQELYAEAASVYKRLLETGPDLSPEDKKEIQQQAKTAREMARNQEQEEKKAEKELAQKTSDELLQQKSSPEKASAEDKASPAAAALKQKPTGPAIPIAKRIKIIPTPDATAQARYNVLSVAPMEANKITASEEGMDLHRLSEAPLRYERIYAICAFTLAGTETSIIHADLFIAGRPRPYRIASNRILYDQFLPKTVNSSFDNFRQFILFLVSKLDSVYLDRGTMTFLKTKKAPVFHSDEDIAGQEKLFWRQIMGEIRCRCEGCGETYWIDGRRVPAAGAKSKCKKCGSSISIKALETAA